MSANNEMTLNISVDTSHLDKLEAQEAQLERIAELCERINNRGKCSSTFTIKCDGGFLQTATTNNATPKRDPDPEPSVATSGAQAAATDAIARSTLEWVQKVAASAAETDKRLAAAKQEEEGKAKALECRLLVIEAGIDHCMASIASLLCRDSLVR